MICIRLYVDISCEDDDNQVKIYRTTEVKYKGARITDISSQEMGTEQMDMNRWKRGWNWKVKQGG